jgi:hypothetical protein
MSQSNQYWRRRRPVTTPLSVWVVEPQWQWHSWRLPWGTLIDTWLLRWKHQQQKLQWVEEKRIDCAEIAGMMVAALELSSSSSSLPATMMMMVAILTV